MTSENMSPEASPNTLARTGVRRVNNKPMLIAIGLLLVFVLIMVAVGIQRASRQNRPEEKKPEKAASGTLFAQEIAGDRQGGIVKASEPAMPPLDAIPVISADSEAPPLPPASTPATAIRESEDEQRFRLARIQQFEAALKAKTGVQTAAPRSAASSPERRLSTGSNEQGTTASNDPTEAYKARLAQLRKAGLIDGSRTTDNNSAGLLQTSGRGNDHAQFADSQNGQNRWQLDARPEAPRTPFELRAGFVIPGTLISGINSELPGQIVAQVSQNVYDTPTGKHLLVPLGSRLVGSYSSNVAYGQSRVLVAWQRIIFPDGKAMDIGALPGADGVGYSGMHDQVNNHYVRLFGSALLMSAITAGISYSQDRNNNSYFESPSASSAMSEALGQQLGQVTAQLISKNMNIAPTLEIRPGYRFNVVVIKDLTFDTPYRSFDYR